MFGKNIFFIYLEKNVILQKIGYNIVLQKNS